MITVEPAQPRPRWQWRVPRTPSDACLSDLVPVLVTMKRP